MPALIQRIECYQEFPYESIPLSVVESVLRKIEGCGDDTFYGDTHRTLKLFECFLQITKNKLDSQNLKPSELLSLSRQFQGALWSEQFVLYHSSRRSRYSRIWRYICLLITSPNPQPKFGEHRDDKLSYKNKINAIAEFESLELDAKALWYWSGWKAYNLNGKERYVPLRGLYKSYGYEFSAAFYQTYASVLQNIRSVRIDGVKELMDFMADNVHKFDAKGLKNANTSKDFWTEFRSHYFTSRFANGQGVKLFSISNAWLYSIVPFSEKLVQSNLIARPTGGMPDGTPTFRGAHTPNQRQGKNGHQENIKLTFPVPLSVTDSEALEMIFGRVQHDLDLVKRWANSKIECVKKRLAEMNLFHTDQLNLTAVFDNALFLTNCYSAYRKIGFKTGNDCSLRFLYGAPLSEVAQALALPTTNTVVPFAYALVANHSEITPEFLNSCDLYDKHGIVSGVIETDAGHYLVSNKYRKGAELAEQKILLTDETYSIVQTLIAITGPARQYLKNIGDPNWRKLFLSTGKGFGYPKKGLSLTIAKPIRSEFAQELIDLGAMPEVAETLSQHCTLTAVRALGGVAKYIETESLVAASKALGHTRFDYVLLKRYIPKPLLDFFSNRWIRIFHQGFILEAMSDSPYALAATDFKSVEEMHTFLNNHALKIKRPPDTAPMQDTTSQKKEIVFCIDENVLREMIKLEEKSNTILTNAKEIYWSKISRKLLTYIESDECTRPDFQDMLKAVKNSHANRESVQ
ncbi:hypothetical protein [Pseudomonas tremae]|uniref:hypothetical protein n=1 Tax=Pseudomonas tremae TaxID=200454 RepID=UPI001F1C88AF|nr:hypothetical protein [Pseudomonas tremae]MCF5802361.1 hypothetical protein [Pseudomonas tremae]MCF5811570.1 hypothetical protein [Pseudomonas tremae]